MSLTAATTTTVLVLSIWTVIIVESANRNAAPAPAVDCSTVVMSMADCLTYVTGDGTVKKPEGSCCSGLKTVLKTNAECLCETFKNSAQLGVTLNITKALSLPSACHLSAPSISNCGISIDAGAAPVLSPMVPSPSTAAFAPDTAGLAPVPVPGSSGGGLPLLGTSAVTLVLGLVVSAAASFSS